MPNQISSVLLPCLSVSPLPTCITRMDPLPCGLNWTVHRAFFDALFFRPVGLFFLAIYEARNFRQASFSRSPPPGCEIVGRPLRLGSLGRCPVVRVGEHDISAFFLRHLRTAHVCPLPFLPPLCIPDPVPSHGNTEVLLSRKAILAPPPLLSPSRPPISERLTRSSSLTLSRYPNYQVPSPPPPASPEGLNSLAVAFAFLSTAVSSHTIEDG